MDDGRRPIRVRRWCPAALDGDDRSAHAGRCASACQRELRDLGVRCGDHGAGEDQGRAPLAFGSAGHHPGDRRRPPDPKIGYDLTKAVSPGIEYCGSLEPIGSFLPASRQQSFAVLDLNLDPEWEINLGIGVSLTKATHRLIIKSITGRRF